MPQDAIARAVVEVERSVAYATSAEGFARAYWLFAVRWLPIEYH